MQKTTQYQQKMIALCWMILIIGFCSADKVSAEQAKDENYVMIKITEGNLFDDLFLQNPLGEPVFRSDSHAEAEVRCLALNIYFEARNEPDQGQWAVGHVVMNRVANKHYPNSVCEVVQQGGEIRLNRCQFSWWCDGRSDKPSNRTAWEKSVEIARAIYSGKSEDPTNGALWYHADYVAPYWKESLSVAVKIGQHVFYRNNIHTKYSVN